MTAAIVAAAVDDACRFGKALKVRFVCKIFKLGIIDENWINDTHTSTLNFNKIRAWDGHLYHLQLLLQFDWLLPAKDKFALRTAVRMIFSQDDADKATNKWSKLWPIGYVSNIVGL